MTSLILPHTDTKMMNLFQAEVARNVANYFKVMQVDQTGGIGKIPAYAREFAFDLSTSQ